MSKINSFAVAFENNAANLGDLRATLDNVLHAAGTPKARKLFLVHDIAAGMRAMLPGVKGYTVVPAETNGVVSITYATDLAPSDHANVAQWFEVLSKRILRQAKSVSQARGYAIEGQRAERSDKASGADKIIAAFAKLTGAEKAKVRRAIAA